VGGTTERSIRTTGRRIAAALFALAVLAGVASTAGAQTPISRAQHRAEATSHQIRSSRGVAAHLQARIQALAAGITDSRRRLDKAQGRLLVAQHGLLAAQADRDAIQTELDQRARAAFEALGPGASAAYLLGADSFADLLDRSVMLDRLQQADVTLADEVLERTQRLNATRSRLQRQTRERAQLLAAIQTRGAELLAAFAEQQAALQRLVDKHAAATRRVGQLERKAAREAGALPFGDWADRFLRYLGAPTCHANRVVVVAWQANEFTQARWNPLATTHRMTGSTDFNEVGVQNYRSVTQGVRASAETLTGGASSYGYGAILDSLHGCAAAPRTAEAIRASSWCHGCSNGAYVSALVPIVEQYFARYTGSHA
jgi:peptidoglycan hydrolase CwlO-like protein